MRLHHSQCYTGNMLSKGENDMTETPLPGDIRQIDDANYLLYDDELAPDLGDDEDLGDFDPFADGDEEDDSDLDAEIDDLPEVGEVDVNEEPVLDELDDEEWNPEWDKEEGDASE